MSLKLDDVLGWALVAMKHTNNAMVDHPHGDNRPDDHIGEMYRAINGIEAYIAEQKQQSVDQKEAMDEQIKCRTCGADASYMGYMPLAKQHQTETRKTMPWPICEEHLPHGLVAGLKPVPLEAALQAKQLAPVDVDGIYRQVREGVGIKIQCDIDLMEEIIDHLISTGIIVPKGDDRG